MKSMLRGSEELGEEMLRKLRAARDMQWKLQQEWMEAKMVVNRIDAILGSERFDVEVVGVKRRREGDVVGEKVYSASIDNIKRRQEELRWGIRYANQKELDMVYELLEEDRERNIKKHEYS